MISRVLFTGLLAAVGVQRLLEVRQSRRNEAALRAQGAVEHAAWQLPVMKALHGVWLVGTAWETWALALQWRTPRAVAALLGMALGQSLRHEARRKLGERWTVRVMVLPHAPPVTTGIYSRLRHPNYAGVVLEMACLPLIHGAWRSALGFSALHSVLLMARIRAEERALQTQPAWDEALARRPRWVPRLRA